MTAPARVPLDARRAAFARAIGKLIAELIWRDLAPEPQNATSSPTEAARGKALGDRREAGYAESP